VFGCELRTCRESCSDSNSNFGPLLVQLHPMMLNKTDSWSEMAGSAAIFEPKMLIITFSYVTHLMTSLGGSYSIP
jgi:hypothetical protein